MEALHDLVKMGKVRYIGASSMHTWEFQKANHVAAIHGWTQFVSMQNLYNLLYREEEREMIPYCIDQGVAQIPWSPLAMGVLCGKNRDTKRSEQSIPMMQFYMGGGERYTKTNDEIVNHVVTLAEKKQVKPAQVSVPFVVFARLDEILWTIHRSLLLGYCQSLMSQHPLLVLQRNNVCKKPLML